MRALMRCSITGLVAIALTLTATPTQATWSPSISQVMSLVYCVVGLADCEGQQPGKDTVVQVGCGEGTELSESGVRCVLPGASDEGEPPTPASWTAGISQVMNLIYCVVGITSCEGLEPGLDTMIIVSCGTGTALDDAGTTCVPDVVVDVCGVPGGDGTSCLDCNGEPYGPALQDQCGACDADPENDCALDCLGVWGGSAVVDACGVCDGPGPLSTDDTTCDGADDDCDGHMDEDFLGGMTTCGVGACEAMGYETCSEGVVQDTCTPQVPSPDDFTCDGVDEDCDGEVDEDCVALCASAGGGCLEPHAGGGCAHGGCCQDVCAVDVTCCSFAWDGVCAELAMALCVPSVCASAEGGCLAPHSGMGCGAPGCCAKVCLDNPYCCDTAWDEGCAAIAWERCVPASDQACCEAGDGPGCGDTGCAQAVCASDPACCTDQWTEACALSAAQVCGLCPGSCCEVGTAAGCTDGACEATVCAADATCCQTLWDDYCAAMAQDHCSACGGSDVPAACVGGAGGCHGVHGTPGCGDTTCCAAVCTEDDFCCLTSWDGECVTQAGALCAAPPIGAGDCCATNGPPGCGDPTCRDLVCGTNESCCSVGWTNTCAYTATLFCDVCWGQ